jgi:hypothetical protein
MTISARDWPDAKHGAAWLARLLVAFLALAAVVLVLRRMAGALNGPPEIGVLLLATLAVLATTVAARLLLRHSGERTITVSAGISVAVLAVAAALSFRAGGKTALTLLWLPLLAAETWAWWQRLRRPRRAAHGMLRPTPSADVLHLDPDDFHEEATPAEDVCQRLTLQRAANGGLVLSGWLRTRFDAGQRSEHVHVAFCPPFANTPQLAVQQRGGPTARVKTAQLLPCGARLDLKLAAASAEPQSVLLWFTATAGTVSATEQP